MEVVGLIESCHGENCPTIFLRTHDSTVAAQFGQDFCAAAAGAAADAAKDLEVHGLRCRATHVSGQQEPLERRGCRGIKVAATSPFIETSMVSPFFTRSSIWLL
ncbi:hypothetical protein PJ267_09435 [Arthrobacter sp. OVS8]|nr:hypothetical protein PJ267_09435 [Arthrobacter sp. OVS8]